jgi:hypothetical protein
MARRVFFSFHYQRDLWRVNVVRNSAVIEGVAIVGFADASLWERARREGQTAVHRLVADGLSGTSVTAVLIGEQTANREYVNYEIEKSIERGNGLLGVRIHHIKDQHGNIDSPGVVPVALQRIGAPIYDYEYGRLGGWIEQAYRKAHPA